MIEMMNKVTKEALSNYKKLFDFESKDDFIKKGKDLGNDKVKAVYLFTVTNNSGECPVYVGMSTRFYDRIRDYIRPPQLQALNDIKIQTEIKYLQDKAKHFSVYYQQVDFETRKEELPALENKEIKRINPYFNRREALTEEEENECDGIDKQVLKLFEGKQKIKSIAKLRKTLT
jgi:hypothetical protein